MAIRTPLPQTGLRDFPNVSSNALRWLDLVRSLTLEIRQVKVVINPASIPANTIVEESFTAPGLKVGDIILSMEKPTLTSGMGVLQGRVDAAGGITLQMINTTSAAIDPPSETYSITYIKNSVR